MRKNCFRFLSALFVLIMAFTVAVLIWYTADSGSIHSRIDEARKDYETAMGRVKKQQSEYEKAVADVTAAEKKLADLQPEAEKAEANADAQKAERKELRKQRDELEEKLLILQSVQEEDSDDEK